MKFPGFFFLTIFVVVLANPWVPYWAVMMLLFILACWVKPGNGTAFLAGGMGMGVAWLGQGVYISIATGSDLADHMAELLGVGSGFVILVMTAGLGFILGSFSALTGNMLRKLFHREQKDIYRGPVSY